MFDYEIGSEFTNTWGGFRKVVGRHKDATGEMWYWAESEDGEPMTYHASDMEAWTRIEPFFRKGDTFEANNRRGEVLYVTRDNEAALVYYDGRSYETVTSMTYRVAENIQHNKG